MILLHRLTSFAIVYFVAGGFYTLTLRPDFLPLDTVTGFIAFVLVWLLVIALLYARLLKWEFNRFPFWVFFSTPLFYFISAIAFFLFLESVTAQYIVGIAAALGMWLYAENLFTFYYLPGSYQPYALEYLSLSMYVISSFFFMSAAYAAQLFLQLPVWIPAGAVFWVVLASTVGVFWVSKIGYDTSLRFALAGAIMMTQVYIALALLPISFLANAAVFSIFLYLYLGLTRAHVLDKLTLPILQRYLAVGFVLTILVFLTSRWV